MDKNRRLTEDHRVPKQQKPLEGNVQDDATTGQGFTAAQGLSRQIARHIGEQIIRGDLVEGERIQELRVAEALGVSRGSVREALLILERSHLIEIFPRRGAVVTEMSVPQVRALFELAQLLVVALMEQASQLWRPIEQEVLAQALSRAEQAARQGGIELFYDGVLGLVRQCADWVRNPYFSELFDNLEPSLRRGCFLTLNTSRRELEEAHALFRQVVEAMLARRRERAAQAMAAFCVHLRDLVLESLSRMKQIELAWAQRSRR